MYKVLTGLFACIFFLSSAPAWAFDADDLSNPKVVEAFVDGVVKPLMAKDHSPSGVFVLMKDGEVVLRKGYGWQNLEQRIPVDPDTTLFRPGSISKLFTWVSVMQLVEQGKLDLDTDLNGYLNTFQIKDTYPGQPITLRHCMTHTPGFEDGFLGYLIIEDPEKVIPLADAMQKYQPERVNPPGVVGAYSNYCTALTGLIVANVSEKSFNDYVEQNIFKVLGMRNASFDEPLPERLAQNMAVAYKYEAGTYIARPFELITNFTPAGALAATATDMLKFGGALLNGGELDGARILSTASLAQMTKRQFTLDDRLKGIGLGFLQYPWGDTDTYGHDGGTTAFISHFGITPSAGLLIFSSFSGPGAGAINAALTREFYEEFFPRGALQAAAPTGFDDRAEKYAGTYNSWRGSFSKIEKLVGLFSQVSVVPDGHDGLMVGPYRFTEREDGLFQNAENGDLMAFLENAQGDVIGYQQNGWPIQSMYKASGYASQELNFGMLGLSIFVFLAVVLRFAYQRGQIQAFAPADSRATQAATIAAASHLWVVVFGGIVAMAVGDQFMTQIPLLFKLWLIFPIVATLVTAWLLYQTLIVWRTNLLAGAFGRVRYSIVCFCALFMVWFYYYWNLLGFNYLA